MDRGRSGRGRRGGRFGDLGAGVVRQRRQHPPRDVVTLGDGVHIGAGAAVDAESVPVSFAAAVGPEFTGLGDAEAGTPPGAQADPDRTAGAERHPAGAPPNGPGSPAAGTHAADEAGASPHDDAQTAGDPTRTHLTPADPTPADSTLGNPTP
ncbi:hypothetical protein AB0D38_37745, partial [Streptomyces sp. NPDC048279]